MAYSKKIVPKGHICNPPRGEKDDQRWHCWGCRNKYWYNKVEQRWELIIRHAAHL